MVLLMASIGVVLLFMCMEVICQQNAALVVNVSLWLTAGSIRHFSALAPVAGRWNLNQASFRAFFNVCECINAIHYNFNIYTST